MTEELPKRQYFSHLRAAEQNWVQLEHIGVCLQLVLLILSLIFVLAAVSFPAHLPWATYDAIVHDIYLNDTANVTSTWHASFGQLHYRWCVINSNPKSTSNKYVSVGHTANREDLVNLNKDLNNRIPCPPESPCYQHQFTYHISKIDDVTCKLQQYSALTTKETSPRSTLSTASMASITAISICLLAVICSIVVVFSKYCFGKPYHYKLTPFLIGWGMICLLCSQAAWVLFSAPAAEDLVIIALKEQESVENQRYFNPLSGGFIMTIFSQISSCLCLVTEYWLLRSKEHPS